MQRGAVRAMEAITRIGVMRMGNNSRSAVMGAWRQGDRVSQGSLWLQQEQQRRGFYSSGSSGLSTPHPASPPPPPGAGKSNVGRPTSVRNKELPKVPNTLPYLAGFVAAAIASWAAFTVYATNKEKLSSSIFKSIVGQVKSSAEVQTLLAPQALASMTPVLKRESWLGGMCRVKGSVNMMQGRVDLSFKITTPQGQPLPPSRSTAQARSQKQPVATVYFTSIRAHKHAPFEILRFLVVNDDTGESVSLLQSGALTTIDTESGDLV